MAKNLYKLSVIIPAFNYGHLLSRAIDSVLKQKETQVQLCVVNDGSTDDTTEKVRPYLEAKLKNDRFLYIEQKNQGPSAARNTGISNVTGDYVLFLDADDALVDGSLNKILQFLAANPKTDFLIGGHYIFNEEGDKKQHSADVLSENKQQRFINYIDGVTSISNGASIFRREFFSSVKYNEELRQIEDVPVFAKALTMDNCYRCNFAFVNIFKHSDSLRNNVSLAKKTNLNLLVNDLFDASYLPKDLLTLKNRFYGNRCLSLFRRLYKAKQYQSARNYFYKGLSFVPLRAINFSYLSKYIRSIGKANKDLNY